MYEECDDVGFLSELCRQRFLFLTLRRDYSVIEEAANLESRETLVYTYVPVLHHSSVFHSIKYACPIYDIHNFITRDLPCI